MIYVIETDFSWVVLWLDNGIEGIPCEESDAQFFDLFSEFSTTGPKLDLDEFISNLEEMAMEHEAAYHVNNQINEMLEARVGVIPRIRELAFRDWNDILTYDMDTLFPPNPPEQSPEDPDNAPADGND